MDTMQKAVLIAHTLIALGIIALVLMQRGKGADAGAAFGAGASGTVFGARGSGSFFSRATAILATAFFVSSLTLAYMSSQRSTGPASLLDEAEIVVTPESVSPASDEALSAPDMPPIESASDDAELPALDDALPATDEPQ